MESLYVGAIGNGEISVKDERDFVFRRDRCIPKSEEHSLVIGDFYARTLPIVDSTARSVGRDFSLDFERRDFVYLMLGVHQKCCEKFEGDSRYSTYLYRAAKNAQKNFIKGRSRFQRRNVPLEEVSDFLEIEEVVSFDDEINANERRDAVVPILSRFIDQLSSLQAKVMRLHLQGLVPKEIAAQLGVGKGSVSSANFYALRTLRRKLEPYMSRITFT